MTHLKLSQTWADTMKAKINKNVKRQVPNLYISSDNTLRTG